MYNAAAYINSLNVKIIREVIQRELIKQSNLDMLPSHDNLLITCFVKGRREWDRLEYSI